jgi:undecaprenyl-diphosphatase
METIKYIILGILQGFTEPIPISSSGHLIIFRKLINLNFLNDLNFEIIVNFGSLLAVVFFFKKDIIKIIKDFIIYLKTNNKESKENYKYIWLIIIGTIPAGIIGLFLKDIIELYLNNIKIIGLSLLFTAFSLFLIKDMKGQKEKNQLNIKDAIIIGLFQIIALIPGISRSGITIVGGMFRNLNRNTAFKYSFMLYIPISVATMILGIKDLINSTQLNTLLIPYFLGMIAATIITYYSLKWFYSIIKKGKLIYFVYYCLIVGTLVILFL